MTNLRDIYRSSPGFNVTVGTEVVCPNCDDVMVVCIRRPEVGSCAWGDCFAPRAFSGVPGSNATCPKCAAPFFGQKSGVYTREYGFTW